MMVRELGFEMKAQPSEKMKTPEELAREEREKLQKLEVWSQYEVAVQHFYLSTNSFLSLPHETLALKCLNAGCDSRFLFLRGLSRLTV